MRWDSNMEINFYILTEVACLHFVLIISEYLTTGLLSRVYVIVLARCNLATAGGLILS